MPTYKLQSASFGLKDRLDVIDSELKDVRARLSKLYDALETVEFKSEELAPRIQALFQKKELQQAKAEVGVIPFVHPGQRRRGRILKRGFAPL